MGKKHEHFRLKTIMRRPPHDAIQVAYCNLGKCQPLILHREPNNPVDSAAVYVTDLLINRVGYVAREDAGEVSARLANGEILLARTNGGCMCLYRRILIWSEGEEVEQTETQAKRRTKVRSPEIA